MRDGGIERQKDIRSQITYMSKEPIIDIPEENFESK